MNAFIALAVFATAVALDFAAARYNLALRDDRIEIGARWSVLMCLLSSAALYAFIKVSPWMLIPELAGLYIGTILGGMWQRRSRPAGSPGV